MNQNPSSVADQEYQSPTRKGDSKQGFHLISEALEAIQMVLQITECKQVDVALLERVMLEMESRASSCNSLRNSAKSDVISTNQITYGVSHYVSGQESETQVGWSRETEQFVELLGKILQQECITMSKPSMGDQCLLLILRLIHSGIHYMELVQDSLDIDLVPMEREFLGQALYTYKAMGHWTRITEPVGGRLSYKPPLYDINAPDLYIPFMAFGTYVVLAGLTLGLNGKFSPEALNWLFVKGLLGWFMQVALLKVTLLSLGSAEAPLLDIVAYAGYTFIGMCIAVLGKILFKYSYYFLMPWACLCMGIFLVKTMKRVLFAEVRSYDSSKHHYLLLFIALAQFPLFTWLGNITINWLF